MTTYDATELAYKNGYKDALKDVLNMFHKDNLNVDQVVAYLSTKNGTNIYN